MVILIQSLLLGYRAPRFQLEQPQGSYQLHKSSAHRNEEEFLLHIKRNLVLARKICPSYLSFFTRGCQHKMQVEKCDTQLSRDSAEIKQRNRRRGVLQIVKITEEFVAMTQLARKDTDYIEIPYKLKWAFVLWALKEIVIFSWSSNNARCCLHRNVRVSCCYSLQHCNQVKLNYRRDRSLH